MQIMKPLGHVSLCGPLDCVVRWSQQGKLTSTKATFKITSKTRGLSKSATQSQRGLEIFYAESNPCRKIPSPKSKIQNLDCGFWMAAKGLEGTTQETNMRELIGKARSS